jgi:anthranilate phosphoribosyltransferase
MPLQFFCPELKNIIDLRTQLGLRSPVHTLSRLLNPLNATHSIQSIFHPAYAFCHQHAALDLGQPHAAVFKGEGGEIERKPEADCVVKRIVNGAVVEDFWPRLLHGRQPVAAQLNPEELLAVWRGELENEYAYQAIIGTTAIALQLLGRASEQQQALALAADYWQQRDRSRI